MICGNCAQRLKTKEPSEGATWHIGKCNYCNQKSYLCAERDWGISNTSGKEVGDKGTEMLKNLLFK